MANKGVRIEETLRIKIGEAKNLNTHNKETFCKVHLDTEQIFTTAPVEKSINPVYGEEFQCKIPRKFRSLSLYVCESPNKQEKVIGKVTLKKDQLSRFYGKDHWFPLQPVCPDSEIQGIVHVEIRFQECPKYGHTGAIVQKLVVSVIECRELSVIHGAGKPKASVTVTRKNPDGARAKTDIRCTQSKRKTTCPTFGEMFLFELEKMGQNHDRNPDTGPSLEDYEVVVSIDMFGKMCKVFMGEVKIPLKDLDPTKLHKAWYCLQPKASSRPAVHQHVNHNNNYSLGCVRLKICYTANHVLPTQHYDHLRNLLIQSSSVKPITSSAVHILGQLVDGKEEVGQPLARIFHKRGQIVPIVSALADHEVSQSTGEPNTIFRGNTLASKCIEELMKLLGQLYLQDTLKSVIDEIFTEKKCCEIDEVRLREGESLKANMSKLEYYMERVFQAIMYSGLKCPIELCKVFQALRETALRHFPNKPEMKYRVVSSFVFLRFFAPAILGPRFFQLRTDMPDPTVNRTLTLISKALQSLGNAACAKSPAFLCKEPYMVPLIKKFTDPEHTEHIKVFLDIISSLGGMRSTSIEAPVILKEGYLTKRAQGRRKWGRKNFKRRYFCLSNHSLTYAKNKGNPALCEIPIDDIMAVEDLEEESFTRKYMFQVVQPQRALYVQAANCVEETEWKEMLNRVCSMNKNRMRVYHRGAYLKGHWLCCKSTEPIAAGCTPVTGGLPAEDIRTEIDEDREMERIHSLFMSNNDALSRIEQECRRTTGISSDLATGGDLETASATKLDTLEEVMRCTLSLQQEHQKFRSSLEKDSVLGSQDFPIGHDGYVRIRGCRTT